jgi:hypothetical protein
MELAARNFFTSHLQPLSMASRAFATPKPFTSRVPGHCDEYDDSGIGHGDEETVTLLSGLSA